MRNSAYCNLPKTRSDTFDEKVRSLVRKNFYMEDCLSLDNKKQSCEEEC